MAEWLEQASQWHEMHHHDLEIMSSNPGWVELEVCRYFCPKPYLEPKIKMEFIFYKDLQNLIIF